MKLLEHFIDWLYGERYCSKHRASLSPLLWCFQCGAYLAYEETLKHSDSPIMIQLQGRLKS